MKYKVKYMYYFDKKEVIEEAEVTADEFKMVTEGGYTCAIFSTKASGRVEPIYAFSNIIYVKKVDE